MEHTLETSIRSVLQTMEQRIKNLEAENNHLYSEEIKGLSEDINRIKFYLIVDYTNNEDKTI